MSPSLFSCGSAISPASPQANGESPEDSAALAADGNHPEALTLEQVKVGLAGNGDLVIALHTSMGTIDCELWPEKAPNTVVNFVAWARGLRSWKRREVWIKQPFFDDTTFHRVVPGFVVQAGARVKDGIDNAGYTIADEIWPSAKHNQAGLLCMANDGPDTGSSQFFILLSDKAQQLDGSYTIFGSCFQTDIADAISRVKTFGERPAEPVKLEHVEVKLAPRW